MQSCALCVRADQTNLMVTLDCQYACAKLNHQAWLEVASGRGDRDSSIKDKYLGIATSAPDRDCTFPEENTRVFSCISDVIQWCESGITWRSAGEFSHSGGQIAPSCSLAGQRSLVANGGHDGDSGCLTQVLVTGSLHLVGTTMNVLGCTVEDL